MRDMRTIRSRDLLAPIAFGERSSKEHNSLVPIPRPNPHAYVRGEKGLVYFERFLGFAGCKMSCDTNYWHGNALSGVRICAAGALSH